MIFIHWPEILGNGLRELPKSMASHQTKQKIVEALNS